MGAVRRTLQRGLDPLAAGLGYELRRLPRRLRLYTGDDFATQARGIRKIQYGCFQNLLQDWVNVDRIPRNKALQDSSDPQPVYFTVDLAGRHPFPDEWFEFAFGEDFLEHLSQADALIFLSEAFRTLKPGGVIRLAFPGLEGVLNAHYKLTSYEVSAAAKQHAYEDLGHEHFFSREEVGTVALHLGFRDVTFCEFRMSEHDPLRGLETRDHQTRINTYVELTK